MQPEVLLAMKVNLMHPIGEGVNAVHLVSIDVDAV